MSWSCPYCNAYQYVWLYISVLAWILHCNEGFLKAGKDGVLFWVVSYHGILHKVDVEYLFFDVILLPLATGKGMQQIQNSESLKRTAWWLNSG